MLGCMLCGEQLKDMFSFFNHIDEKHPELAEKIKQELERKGLIKRP